MSAYAEAVFAFCICLRFWPSAIALRQDLFVHSSLAVYLHAHLMIVEEFSGLRKWPQCLQNLHT